MRRRLYLFLSLLFLLAPSLRAGEFKLPLKSNSVRFAAIGDMGTGDTPQYEVAQRMVEARQGFPFDFVIMLGDNIYGGSRPRDFEKKFEAPYKPLLDAGVKFYAALGNHDNPNERFYKFFNMNGATYYAFKKGNVHFFVLDSDYMDPKQLAWLETQLQNAGRGDWKICYFHHPLYSSGRMHGPATDLRLLLEPLFVRYGVDVVFAGHEHIYERIQPQKGIYYFIEGASGQLGHGKLNKTDITSKGFDTDRTFMLVEIAGDEMYFQTISRAGATVDSGVIQRTAPRVLRLNRESSRGLQIVTGFQGGMGNTIREPREADPRLLGVRRARLDKRRVSSALNLDGDRMAEFEGQRCLGRESNVLLACQVGHCGSGSSADRTPDQCSLHTSGDGTNGCSSSSTAANPREIPLLVAAAHASGGSREEVIGFAAYFHPCERQP